MIAMIRGCLLLAVLASGCMKRSATYCAKHGADDPDNCPPVDAPGSSSCESNADCTILPSTLVCNTSSETCVECNAATMQADACVDDEPVCGSDDACRPCENHDECLSRACLPDGRCGTDADVAYVAQTGAGLACTLAAPCAKIAEALALAPQRTYVKISGVIDESVVVMDRNVTFLAASGARIVHAGGALLQVGGTSNVTVFDLQLGVTTSTLAATGVELLAGLVGTVSLQRVRIVGSTVQGVLVSGGTLELERSTISDNPGGGVVVRSSATDFVIRNNFIQFNGRASGNGSTNYGGVLIEKSSATSKFVFNTIAHNESSGDDRVAGVACIGPLNVMGGNLIYGNREGNDMGAVLAAAQFQGSCDRADTFLATTEDIGFADASTSSFDPHLTLMTPITVRDAIGDCATRVLVDFDGQPRPSGGPCDIGADELVP